MLLLGAEALRDNPYNGCEGDYNSLIQARPWFQSCMWISSVASISKILCTSVVKQLCRVWSLSNNKCINEKKNGSINGTCFFSLILNLFFDLGNNVAISMDEEEFFKF